MTEPVGVPARLLHSAAGGPGVAHSAVAACRRPRTTSRSLALLSGAPRELLPESDIPVSHKYASQVYRSAASSSVEPATTGAAG
ncbi:hypothetical protein GA0070624_5906 [Micromonospora rhizosphaerae]|uniref:Uncharacterized protein n=1 Tax=Micromonospora rhizosphaerae TaxID=568872 RepID=A0A1C6T6U5_9ACTN|nr:hypothetical protein GA0070624_5906 [Micromonospora rhizosphaerae]